MATSANTRQRPPRFRGNELALAAVSAQHGDYLDSLQERPKIRL